MASRFTAEYMMPPHILSDIFPKLKPGIDPDVVPEVVPKVVPKVVPEVVSGKSFLSELGVIRFKWTIEDFKGFLDIGQTIISPSFNMETTAPSSKVRSFHLEMEIPSKAQDTKYPIYLVNETGGEILTKITLEGFYCNPCVVSVSLETGVVVHKLKEKKQVMTVTLSKSNHFPKEVTIEIKVTLCQPAETIQKYQPRPRFGNRVLK